MMVLSMEGIYRKRLEEEGLSRWWDFLERKGQVHKYYDSKHHPHWACRICGREVSDIQMGSHFRQRLVKLEEHQRWVQSYRSACEVLLAKVLREHGLEAVEWEWCGESIAFVAKTGSIPRRLLRKVRS